MKNATEIFERYQSVSPRLPGAPRQTKGQRGSQHIDNLSVIAEQVEAFVFDAFGVLNVGETLIPGADHRIAQLREMGCQIRILTNAASYERRGAIAKFGSLGIALEDDEIITSRDATLQALTDIVWGVIATDADELLDIPSDAIRLGNKAEDYDKVQGFLFLSSQAWSSEQQDLLIASLQRDDRPTLIANADLVAPRDDGFSLEPGFHGHQLVDAGAKQVQFFGKPFPEVFALAEQSLPGIACNKIVMCGDTLHTDILGAAARGWNTAFITRDGLFAGHDTEHFCQESGIHATWTMPRI